MKLNTFKRDIAEDSELKGDQILKKLKSDNSYKFKYTGIQKQFEFNEEIKSQLTRIERAAEYKGIPREDTGG